MQAIEGNVSCKFIRLMYQLFSVLLQDTKCLSFHQCDIKTKADSAAVSLLAERDSDQKAVAREATNIFDNHYLAFLTRSTPLRVLL